VKSRIQLIAMRIPAATFVVLILAGCNSPTSPSAPNWNGKLSDKFPESVRTALEQEPEFELLSLDPQHRDEDAPTEFYRRRVVGKIRVNDPAMRKRLLGALDASVRAENESAKCFDPRHAIRVRHSGRTFYLVICFHCNNVYIYSDDNLEHQDYIATNISPLDIFDEALKAANIPLAKDGGLRDQLDKKPKRNQSTGKNNATDAPP
jgi:hypothetical protein